jgi:charged multivesicular body protein 2A
LERQEKTIALEIKKLAAKAHNESAIRTLAKQIVRIRTQKESMMKSKATLTSVGLQTTAMKTNLTMQRAVGGTVAVMNNVNRLSDPAQTAQVMRDFQQQSEMMDMKDEMLDDLLNSESDEEETEAVVSQVFDEIGLDLDEKLVSAPTKVPGQRQAVAQRGQASAKSDKEVEELLNSLKV